MGSRSGSRERRRHRSRSRSPRRDRDSNRDKYRDDQRIKKEPTDASRRQDRERSTHQNDRKPHHAETRVKREDDGSDGGARGFGRPDENPTEEVKEPEKPSFALSGKLMEDTNVYNGVVIKYSEPEEARKPKKRWRFYVFKGDETLPVMHLHRQSAYLIGKDRKIADIPVDHPSCSRQHAVLQYRFVNNRTVPYIIDLGSSNGTYLNNNKIDPQRYVELREKDVLKFGYSSREYVLLHENSDA